MADHKPNCELRADPELGICECENMADTTKEPKGIKGCDCGREVHDGLNCGVYLNVPVTGRSKRTKDAEIAALRERAERAEAEAERLQKLVGEIRTLKDKEQFGRCAAEAEAAKLKAKVGEMLSQREHWKGAASEGHRLLDEARAALTTAEQERDTLKALAREVSERWGEGGCMVPVEFEAALDALAAALPEETAPTPDTAPSKAPRSAEEEAL